MDPFFLELQLTVTCGSYDAVGSLRLFCWLKAIKMGADNPLRGKMVVLRSSAPGSGLAASEHELATNDVEQLAAHLRQLRFPEERPRVEGVFDTSDVWEQVVLRGTFNDDSDTLELSMCASSFEGEDAAALRAAFRCLLEMAGVLDEDDWYNLTGSRAETGSE